ncbi:hypothetical protein [Accumulibacter sp.]|uniref:hypothetical protein n=1 Tax=Accumulibacter sp. TaxID=2053492 RepID=UPI0025E66EEF|nr:hypothetical protein [Accumulibacter sp.]
MIWPKWLPMLPLAGVLPVNAGEAVSVCYNYGCPAQAEVIYADEQLAQVQTLLAAARTAADERQALSLAVGWLLGWAGQQTPVSADRGGNTADDGVEGRMDCIDHSTTTTRLLRLLEARGWLRFHRVLEPVSRVRYLFQVHYSAQIEETGAVEPVVDSAAEVKRANAEVEAARYVVDSWFRDNGQPAVVIALQDWFAGRDDHDRGDDELRPTTAVHGRGQDQTIER